MSAFLYSLVQRTAGDAEPGTIRPQQNPWRSYNAPGDDVQWDLQPRDSQYPVTDDITSDSTKTEISHHHPQDDRGRSSDDTPEQHRQEIIKQPPTPDRQKDAKSSAGTKNDRESDSAEHPVRIESNPPRLRITSEEKMQQLNADLYSRTESKSEIEIPVSHTKELKEREYLEKVVERVKESQVEIRNTYQNTLLEIPPVTNQDITRTATESGASEPGPKMIQPQSRTPAPVEIPAQKSTEPDVVIENLTVEVVREKKAPPVKKVRIPVVDQKRAEPQKTGGHKSVGTKLRFGLGQM
ncbi:MAG: hypothetical protein GF372_01350 [Candidatus Marinimicrobia bacterium]|nr:hypothetical protein [Candidatus Neomarinimicrobiota bacterium]